MEKRDDGGPAFPSGTGNTMGMTLRQWYAGMALQGWVSSLTPDNIDSYMDDDTAFAQHQRAVARTCFGYADAMIAEDKEGKR